MSMHPISTASSIQIHGSNLIVPPIPIIPFIEGDGIGGDIWPVAKQVMDSAVFHAYGKDRQLGWIQVFAGERSYREQNTWLPEITLESFKNFHVGIKGPLTTPIGEGVQSINVALRKSLDLYACIRPIQYFPGVPSPMRHPEKVDIVLFRENVEDVYAGIDFPFDSEKAIHFREWLKDRYPEDFSRIRFPETSGIGIKIISREESFRMTRCAIEYAVKNGRNKITLVHKGNIMKYTEGAFARWAYQVAETEYGNLVYTHHQYLKSVSQNGKSFADQEKSTALDSGKIFINDLITDAMFDRGISHPEEFDIVLTTNLNGDYLADALASLVGGIGISPGANINFETGNAIFESTHGTAPTIAGKNIANPCSLILSGELMLRYLGWKEAADLIHTGVQKAIQTRYVTADFYEHMKSATLASTSEFANRIMSLM